MELRRDRCIEQTPEMPRKDAGYSGGYQIDLGANLEAEETLPQLSSLSRGNISSCLPFSRSLTGNLDTVSRLDQGMG